MTLSVAVFAIAAAVDGQTVLRHASALTALGPHPYGSPRTRAAAEYVASQLRDVGVGEVQVEEFQAGGHQGANVVGVLRAPGPEFLVIAAHHDTAPTSPSAHEAGGGPGLLIELGRVFARDPSRPRTLVFASLDGGAAGGVGATAYLATLGPRKKDLVAAVVLSGFGWKDGALVVQTFAQPDKPPAGPYSISPAWVVRRALEGASRSEAPLAVGDPGWLSWLYQPAVRTFRTNRSGGGEAAFAQASVGTLLLDDAPAARVFPLRDQATDTADKLDQDALTRAGQAVVGALRAITEAPRGGSSEPAWFAAFGRVFGSGILAAVGILSLVPGLLRGFRAGGPSFVARIAQAMFFGVLLWRNPVPALAVLLLPNLASAAGSLVLSITALAGALALATTGFIGWRRGIVTGTWLEAFEIALLALALAVSLVPLGSASPKARPAALPARAKGLPKGQKRRPRAR